ncbi:MAG: YciI family protein [Desulfovibrionaceae bacterium]
MFVILVTYTKPLEEIDKALVAHRAFLKSQYDAGLFLASGPQNPRTGGVILAQAADRAALEAVLATDPFRVQGVADYTVIEFQPLMTDDRLAFLRAQS